MYLRDYIFCKKKLFAANKLNMFKLGLFKKINDIFLFLAF